MQLTKKRKKGFKLNAMYLMVLPGIVYFFINNYIPMFGLVIAFKDIDYSKGILKSDWVGLKNFRFLFATKDALLITKNTLLYNITFILIILVAAVFIAILLNEVRRKVLARFYQSVVLIPFLISMVIVGYLVFAMLSLQNGFMNKTILPALGLESVQWYSEPKYWPFILTIVKIWKETGYSCVLYYAAIIGINHELFEAAEIDGATKIKQILHITLPQIKQVLIIMTLLSIGRIFYADFGLFYQVPMNAGALMPATNVIDTYVFRALLQLGNISMGSAAGLYQSVVGFVLIILANFIVRKIDRNSAMF